MTIPPMLAIVDPRSEADVAAFLKLLSEGYKVVTASGMHHGVVYVLLKANE